MAPELRSQAGSTGPDDRPPTAHGTAPEAADRRCHPPASPRRPPPPGGRGRHGTPPPAALERNWHTTRFATSHQTPGAFTHNDLAFKVGLRWTWRVHAARRAHLWGGVGYPTD